MRARVERRKGKMGFPREVMQRGASGLLFENSFVEAPPQRAFNPLSRARVFYALRARWAALSATYVFALVRCWISLSSELWLCAIVLCGERFGGSVYIRDS